MDEDQAKIEVVVPDEQLSLAIDRRGQNVRLASQLTGWDIDILTEEEESVRRQKEFAERTELFTKALDVDEMVGQLLSTEGFTSVEEVAYVELDEIAFIEGLMTTRQLRFRHVLANTLRSLKPSRMLSGLRWALLMSFVRLRASPQV